MPHSSPSLCSKCGAHYRGRCPRCSSGWSNGRKPKSWKDGQSSDRRWRKLRLAFLRANPVCQWPGCADLATRVDHVDGTDYETERYVWAKLRALCTTHHDQRTTRQGNDAQGRG